jgi:hypothetical protein
MAIQATEMTGTLHGLVKRERPQRIAALAFEFWLERAFRDGSPETDWLRADQEVRRKMGAGPRTRTTAGLFLLPPGAQSGKV